MSDQPTAEADELRLQVARLEAENAVAQGKLREQDEGLRLLLLLLAVDRGIYVVRKQGGSDWEFLTREQYIQYRGGKLPESNSQKVPASNRKRAA